MSAPSFASQLRFDAATSLALELDFDGPQLTHFGAPGATSTAFVAGDFTGDVTLGASCNCRSISLTPHCNGTHTESVGHLTRYHTPLHRFVPIEPVPGLLLTVSVADALQSGEDSDPLPQAGDQIITAASLKSQWPGAMPFEPRALLIRTQGRSTADDNPPYLSRQAAEEIAARGIEHLVLDLPSADRSRDEGLLTAHRIFFGLPVGSIDAREATRSHCTITELAQFPASLSDGPCALLLQLPAFTGDAVPSRPVHVPLVGM